MKRIGLSKISGFTLIELMVVVAIIALLTSILLVNFTSARAKARDAKRISDVGQLQLTWELFFDRCKQYPATLSLSANNNCPSTPTQITLGTYISQLPAAPNAGETYGYAVDSSASGNYSNYVMHTTLEIASDKPQDGLSVTPSFPGVTLGFICTGSTDYCVGPK